MLHRLSTVKLRTRSRSGVVEFLVKRTILPPRAGSDGGAMLQTQASHRFLPQACLRDTPPTLWLLASGSSGPASGSGRSSGTSSGFFSL